MKTGNIFHKLFFNGLVLLSALCVNAQYYEYKPIENFGGKSQLHEFLSSEMVYPAKALSEKVEGTVVIHFGVNKMGEVTYSDIQQSVSDDLDAEALRLFRYFLWEPAAYRSTPVDDEAVMEVDFKIKKYQRNVKKRGYDQIIYPYSLVDSSFTIFKPAQLTRPPRPIFEKQGMRFADFIQQNMVYPSVALKQSISGMVEMFFVVEPTGRVSNIKLLKSVSGGCNEEAVRLLKMLYWAPGIHGEKAVRTEMIMQIRFNLADFQEMRYIPPSNNNQF